MPGAIHSDEVNKAKGKPEKKKDKAKDKKTIFKAITLTSDIMRKHSVALEAPASDYSSLSAIDEGVLVLEQGKNDKFTLKKIGIDHKSKIETIAKKIDD